jgi:cytochrome c biogenesis protein CcdA
MAYYILVRRVTLLSAFAFAWAMTTVIYWVVFPIWLLTDALLPWIWWLTAWVSHMVFALGLWMAPKIFQRLYKRPSEMSAVGSKGSKETSNYQRSWKTTLFAILASQGFGLMFGSAFFGYVVTSQPPSIYPVFGYGKPPPSLSKGLVPTIGQL